MNPEHVSVEECQSAATFPGISSLQKPLISPSLAVCQAAFEERHELQCKQKIIGSALKRIIERGLCGLEQVKAYLVELYRRNCRPNTLRTHAVTITGFLVYLKGSEREGLKAIDREAIGGFVEHQQDLGLTANTISVRLRGLYSFLKYVVGRGELSAEVLTRKLRIQLPKSLPRAIDPQAVRQMLGVIDHVRDRAIVLVLLRTGMRIGELLDTRLQEVNLSEQKIEILEAQKTRVGRVVYLSEDACVGLRQWLAQRSAKSAYLFHGMGRSRLG
jgi:site-specific recombinase XerC